MPTDQKVHFIPIENLLEMITNKEGFVLVDVLAKDSYAEGHLPLAISLPVEEMDARAANVLPDKQKIVVTYCASYMCHASTDAAQKLQSMGYAHVLDYKGGKKDWESRGMPMAKAQ